ncbi:MAG: hypothetical protein AAF919_02415 [Pseudomonadota bacterium]
MWRMVMAGVAGLVIGFPAQASEMDGSYLAVIGPSDLTNSRGERLRRPAQVLRQDRANVHRFGIRQEGDDIDPFFDRPEKRNEIDAMLGRGQITPEVGRAILAGDVSIFVRVYHNGEGTPAMDVILLR